jgi:hypothetical protein
MNEAVMKFRQELSDSVELQEKLQESEEGLTEFEMDVVSVGRRRKGSC